MSQLAHNLAAGSPTIGGNHHNGDLWEALAQGAQEQLAVAIRQETLGQDVVVTLAIAAGILDQFQALQGAGRLVNLPVGSQQNLAQMAAYLDVLVDHQHTFLGQRATSLLA